MSAFSELLTEARDTLLRKRRVAIWVHFDWAGVDGPSAWSCWYDAGPVAFGSSGEEALRRMVEALRDPVR